MDARRERCLDVMGISRWERRVPASVAVAEHADAGGPVADVDDTPEAVIERVAPTPDAPPVPPSELPPESPPEPAFAMSTAETDGDAVRELARADLAALELPELATRVAACTACGLAETRRQTVFGVGGADARVMVIGEAPGAEEDRQGVPFVGPAGQLLNAMLAAIGVAREEVYIANILKCRPPRNRDPVAEEVAACSPFLLAQIERIDPAVLVAVGRVAAQTLLNSTTPIGRLRTGRHTWAGRPLLVTYHPAYLLRSPLEKRKAWTDLQALGTLLAEVEGRA